MLRLAAPFAYAPSVNTSPASTSDAGPAPAGPTPAGTTPAGPGAVSTVVVEVMLKPEIHDPQGEAIAGACHRLGFGEVLAVRQGKRFEVQISAPPGAASQQRIAELAAGLLANPVIEEFTIHAA